MHVDDLLLHLCARIVYQNCYCNTDHERYIAREDILDQQSDNCDRQDDVEDEQFRTSQILVLLRSSCLFLCAVNASLFCKSTI